MIYNDSIKSSYGRFDEVVNAAKIIKYRPTPTDSDYKSGYINRYFAKKVNENVIWEVEYGTTSTINNALYKVVKLNWKITGPKNNVADASMLKRAGVMEQNRFEIDRIKKEEDVDLTAVLPNLLEYWRGS